VTALEIPIRTRREWIDAYVKRKWIPRLAPRVERVADWLDGRAGIRDEGPILRAPPSPGAVRLRPDARKVLAFDYNTAFRLVWTLLFVELAASEAIGDNVLHQFGFLAYLGVELLALSVALVGFVLAVAHRLCQLRRLLARCVVVTARLVTTQSVDTDQLGTFTSFALEYVYAGALYTSRVMLLWSEEKRRFVGNAPEVLVDTRAPTNVLIRDFYT